MHRPGSSHRGTPRTLSEAAKDRDRVLDGGFVDENRLEAAFERGSSRRACGTRRWSSHDHVQLAAREHRLSSCRSPWRFGSAGAPTVCSSSTNKMMRPSAAFTSDSTAFRRSRTLSVLRPAIRAPRSSAEHVLSRRPSGRPRNDPLREPSTIAVSRHGIADEHGVVLRLARQDLGSAPDLGIASDDGIELTGACFGHEIPSVLLECLVGTSGFADVTRWFPGSPSATKEAVFRNAVLAQHPPAALGCPSSSSAMRGDSTETYRP